MPRLLSTLEPVLKPPESYVQPGPMERFGVANIRRLARPYNHLRFAPYQRFRRRQYRQFEQLLRENGPLSPDLPVMRDGWALDTSGNLPGLDELLRDAHRIVEERGAREDRSDLRTFMRDIFHRPEDYGRFPAFLNFILSSDVLKVVGDYLRFVPALSNTVPPGVRFTESSCRFDPASHAPPRLSQQFHLDLHDSPMAYVIVLARDVTAQSGPFCFLPASASARAARALRYKARGEPWYVSDKRMYDVIDRSDLNVLAYPRGTVLFIDSSRCFHYGSRRAEVPRYQIMYALVSSCRTDFTRAFMPAFNYDPRQTDSRLRRMVLRSECQL